MTNDKNPFIIPAVIIAAGLVAAVVAYRVIPAPGRGRGFASPESQEQVMIPDSASASLVTRVSGDKVVVRLAARPGRTATSVTLVVNAATGMFDANGLPLKDRRIKADDLIEFFPADIPAGTTEIVAESVRLIFRPPENR